MGNNPFEGCSNLKKMEFAGENPPSNFNFYTVAKTGATRLNIYVPDSAVEDYRDKMDNDGRKAIIFGENWGWALSDNTATFGGNTGEQAITITGVKSANNLTILGTVVTVPASALDEKTVEITGSISGVYTLALADDLQKSSEMEAVWTIEGTTATYNKAETSEGYKISDNKISLCSQERRKFNQNYRLEKYK